MLAREGLEKLERMFPPIIRDRSEFHALQAVNADGHRWDVFVSFPDKQKPIRPLMLAIQDLYSGKILAWRIAENEGADTVSPDSRLPMSRAHTASNPDIAPIGASSGDANLGTGLHGWHWLTLRRGVSSWGVQLAMTDTLSDEKFQFRRSAGDGSFGPWRTVWTTVNFNPETKATLGAAARFAKVGVGVGAAELYSEGGTDNIIVRVGADPNARFYRFGDDGSFDSLSGPIKVQGAVVWHTANFNPADKAPAIHSHDWAQITEKPDLAAASAADYRSASAARPAYPSSAFAAAVVVGLAQAGTIAVDLNAGLNFTTTMTGNRTLGNPTNQKVGQSGVIELVQDGTGGRTLTFGSAWKFANGVVPSLSTAPGARDYLVFTVMAGDFIVASLVKDVR